MPVSTALANVADFLLEGKDAAQIALLTSNRTYTYGDLQQASLSVALHLVGNGVRVGDLALLASDNSFFWVAAYLGVLRAGMVCVPVAPTVSEEDLQWILQTTEARCAFVQTSFLRKRKACLHEITVIADGEQAFHNAQPIASLLQNSATPLHALPGVQTDDLAALMFTSGSTGRPRGVMVSHGNIMANTNSIIQYLSLTEQDRMMTVLPFHYCFGTSLLHTHLRAGGSLVLDSRFMYPEVVVRNMRDTNCTGFAGVPSHYRLLLENSSMKATTFPALRHVQQAGGHLDPASILELQRALPHAEVFVMYGQTEATARLSYLPPERLADKIGSIGKGIPGVTLKVVDDTGREVLPGEVGEVVAEGANVTRGYWRAPNATSECFRDGKLYTGDLAKVDEDGFVYIVDRAKDILKCGGKRVSCRQLEEQISQFGDLVEAAVVGIPDEVLGEAVKVVAVPRVPFSSNFKKEFIEFCKRVLPHELVPKEIVFRDSLPKTSAGKISKSELRSCEGSV